MSSCASEPPLREIIQEPITQLLMARDRVDPGDLNELIERVRRHLAARPQSPRALGC